jgi:hypothetical protein
VLFCNTHRAFDTLLINSGSKVTGSSLTPIILALIILILYVRNKHIVIMTRWQYLSKIGNNICCVPYIWVVGTTFTPDGLHESWCFLFLFPFACYITYILQKRKRKERRQSYHQDISMKPRPLQLWLMTRSSQMSCLNCWQ